MCSHHFLFTLGQPCTAPQVHRYSPMVLYLLFMLSSTGTSHCAQVSRLTLLSLIKGIHHPLVKHVKSKMGAAHSLPYRRCLMCFITITLCTSSPSPHTPHHHCPACLAPITPHHLCPMHLPSNTCASALVAEPTGYNVDNALSPS